MPAAFLNAATASAQAYPMSHPELHIVVANPLGPRGQGGINTLMLQVLGALEKKDASIRVHMLTTRGKGPIVFSIYWMLRAFTLVLYYRITGRIDVLHVNLSKKGSTYRKILLCGLARMCRIPYLIHLHSGHYDGYWSNTTFWVGQRISRMFLSAARVIVLGSIWRDLVIDKLPTLSSRVLILHNATRSLSARRAPSEDGHVRILFLGKLWAQKGVPQLVEALALLKALPNWRAMLAGDGDVTKTQGMVATLGLCNRVQVPGQWVGPDDVQMLISQADILVLPSFNEGLPMSVIEGMAGGLAVVATSVGAIKDIIQNEKTGLLVPPGNVPALASAIRRLIESPVLRQQLAHEARAFHQAKLEISSYTDHLCRIWRDVAEESNVDRLKYARRIRRAASKSLPLG